MLKNNRKKLAIALGLMITLMCAGVAYAYWTTAGTGTGTAGTGTTTSVTANQTSTVTGMYPGDSPQALSGDFANLDSGPVYVASIAAAVTSTDKVGCDAADYTIGGSPMTVAAQVPSGTGVGSWSGATIQFDNDAATNQDACKGAAVTITYTVN